MSQSNQSPPGPLISDGAPLQNYYACISQIASWGSDQASWILFLKYIRANIYKGDLLLSSEIKRTNFQLLPRTGSILLQQLLITISNTFVLSVPQLQGSLRFSGEPWNLHKIPREFCANSPGPPKIVGDFQGAKEIAGNFRGTEERKKKKNFQGGRPLRFQRNLRGPRNGFAVGFRGTDKKLMKNILNNVQKAPGPDQKSGPVTNSISIRSPENPRMPLSGDPGDRKIAFSNPLFNNIWNKAFPDFFEGLGQNKKQEAPAMPRRPRGKNWKFFPFYLLPNVFYHRPPRESRKEKSIFLYDDSSQILRRHAPANPFMRFAWRAV